MLDLNIATISAQYKTVEQQNLGAQNVLEASSTSVSSIVNADEAPASTGGDAVDSTSGFSFNMLFEKCDRNVGGSPELQLFPVIGGELSNETASSTSLLRPQWLNLSVPEAPVDYRSKVIEEKPPPPPVVAAQPAAKKSRRGPRSRSSQYRGVTFYRRTGRWESHIWDCGKQVYLGGFDTAHAAARAYDRAAVKFRGIDADINFTISDYEDDLKQMKDLTKEEFVQILRRQCTGFSRGSSKFRGVTLHKCGRWEARMGQLLGKKAYDKAAIECNGREAVTNFESSNYEAEVTMSNNNNDRHHDLELNLSISSPSGSLKGNDNIRSMQLHEATYELTNSGKRSKVESFVSTPTREETSRTTVASKQHPTWPGIYTGFSPNYEERATRKPEAEASLGFTNWAWQMNGQGVVTPVPMFSTAASSGFASTTQLFSGTLLSPNAQNKKLCVSSPANGTPLYYGGKN